MGNLFTELIKNILFLVRWYEQYLAMLRSKKNVKII